MHKTIKDVEQLLDECRKHIDTHPSLAEEAALKALDLSSKSGFKEGRFESLLSMSYIRNRMSQKDRALKTLEECLKIAKELKEPHKIAQVRNALGITYSEMKIYSRAIGYFLEALAIARSNDLKQLECQINNNIASVFMELKDYNKGLSFLINAHEKALAAKEPEALYLRNISNCCLKLGQYDKAYKYCILARNANWHEMDGDIWPDIYFILAIILLKKNRPIRSMKAFRLGKLLSEKYRNTDSEIEGSVDLAQALLEDGQYERAIELLHTALEISDAHGIKEHHLKIYRLLSEAERKTGNLEKENEALRVYLSLTGEQINREIEIKKAYAAMQVTRFSYGQSEKADDAEEIDTLTGFIGPNEHQSLFSSALEASDQHGILLIITVDNLKQVNEKYGQHAGDKLITEFSGTLDRIFGDAIKVRKAADEFLILIPGAGKGYAKQLLEELSAAMLRPRIIGKSLMNLTWSAGIAASPEDSDTLRELEHMAYVALFQAKRTGKRTTLFYDTLFARIPERSGKA